MKTKDELLEMLFKLKTDERNYYKIATVFSNAPLALIQLQLSTEINLLERILGIPLSKFPLQKAESK